MAAFQIATTLLWVSVCRSILIHAFEECISTPIPLPIDNPRIGVPQVVTSSNTYIWSIFMNRGDTVRVFYCKHPCNGHWEDSDQMQSMAEQFDLDASGEYICGVNAFRVFCRSEESLTWNLANVSTVDQDGSGYPLNLVDIAVSKRTKYIWGVNDTRVYFCERSNRDNFVYSCVQPNDTETLILQIDAGDEEVWGVNASHYIFKRPVNGSGEWTMVPGTMRYVSASGSNYIWGIAPNNSLFNCEMPCTGDWQYIGGSFRQIDGFNEYTIGVDINNTTQSLSCTLSGELEASTASTDSDPRTSMSTITGKTAVLSTVAIIIVSNTFVVLVIVAVIVVVICKKFCAKSDNEKFTPTLRQTTHDTGFGYPVTEPDNSHGFENRSYSNDCTAEYEDPDEVQSNLEAPTTQKDSNKGAVGRHSNRSQSQSNSFRVYELQRSIPNEYSKELGNERAQTATVTGINHREPIPVNDGHYEFDNADGGAAESVAKENDTGDTEEYEYAYEEEFWVPASQETELKLQLDKFLRIPVVEEEDLKIQEELGRGQFGIVNKGMWLQTDSEEAVEVAVKSMEGGASEEDKVKFLQEAAIMGQFNNHPNILSIVGIALNKQYKIVVELMDRGDLHNYLISVRPKQDQPVSNELSPTLLSYSRQVASGLMYLAFKKYVHRDIAARNVLVSSVGICKIADFGLSRDLYDGNYYVSRGGMIPVKWTAPEALYYRKYSTASDIWSYGCLLYEIWSLGIKPFFDLTNKQAMEKIQSGYRLPPPPGCPRTIYHIMIKCWHPIAASRSPANTIVTDLSRPDFLILKWAEGDIATTSEKARTLGSPLTEGQFLYRELQQIYGAKY